MVAGSLLVHNAGLSGVLEINCGTPSKMLMPIPLLMSSNAVPIEISTRTFEKAERPQINPCTNLLNRVSTFTSLVKQSLHLSTALLPRSTRLNASMAC